MPKSKLTLLVDGNWLLMSRLSVLNNNYVDDFELCQDLKLLMIKSINVVLRTFPFIDNVIFCADGGSWRNKIEIPSCLHHEEEGQLVEYKGTRTRSADVNWDVIFDGYNDFISVLQQTGITACKEKDIEGDDWIYHWSKYLNSQGTNCIIWSKDNDLKQLVSTDSNKCFTIWWNKDYGVFTDEHEENEFDFMFNYAYSQNEELFNNIVSKSVNTTQINPKHIVINKILKGDGSDNILPIILRKSKPDSEKKFKISSKDIDYSLDYHNDEAVLSYLHSVLSSKKYLNKVEHTEQEIFDHFKYNRQLVVLETSSYPENILEIFNENTEYNLNKDFTPAEHQIQAYSNKLKGLLDII